MKTNKLALVALVVAGCNNPVVTQLSAPPQGQGFQLHVAPFDVPAATEIQACYFFTVPGDPTQEIWVNRYEMAQAAGSHHMNIFRVNTIKNLIPDVNNPVVGTNGMGECFKSSNWSDWPLVTNTQQASLTDWKLPDGVGAKFHGGDMLMLQTHFVNATTQVTPAKAEVSVNFWTMPSAPANELGTLFATNQNIRICPGDTDKSFTKNCIFPAPTAPATAFNIVAANGHFHSRGIEFQMFTVDGSNNVGPRFYDSLNWADPPMMRDFSMPIPVGGGVQWECTYDFPTGACGNPNDSCCYTFGGQVETQEHCNAFVYYWPKVATATDITCM